MLFEILCLCFVICFLGYFTFSYAQNKHTYWSVRGVNGPKPTFLLGNLLTRLGSCPSVIDPKWLLQYGKVYGVYNFLNPSLVIHDPVLIKQILIKDFSVFVNRTKLKTYHEMWNQNLFASDGEEWRRVRTLTTPAFTSGKLRGMHKLMAKCVDKLIDYLDDLVVNGEGVMASTKEVISGFTVDVIASTAFATETNANDNRTDKSPFVINGAKLFYVNPIRGISSILLPEFVLKLLNIKTIFDPAAFQFFIDLSREIVRKRKQTGQKRNDFVQLLMDASIDEKEFGKSNYDQLTASMELDDQSSQTAQTSPTGKSLTESQIIAQCIIFFIAGFETTASTIFHCIYELAKNQDVQQKLFEVISSELKDLTEDSDEYFDKINNDIPFLEATIKETLRMYPPVTLLTRVLQTDNYKLAGITLPKGQSVEVSAYAVQHNAEYYPEPERFNPDRFMPENKHLLTPYTYLPFGAGPRNCVGLRFAYQELKLCLAKLVTRYCFHPTEDTPKELTFKKASPLLNTSTFPTKVTKRN